MHLLILVNGKKEILIGQIRNLFLNNGTNFDVIKLDEKMLAKFSYVLKQVKSKKYDKIFFGCIDFGLQRFKGFMHIYIYLSNVKSGGIIDESGAFVKYTTPKFLFRIFPALLFEGLISAFVVIFFYLKLFLSRWVLLKVKS